MLHIFGKQPMDVRRCAEAFRELYPDRASRVVVLSDVVYAHAMGECRGREGARAGRVSLAALRALQSSQGRSIVRQAALSLSPDLCCLLLCCLTFVGEICGHVLFSLLSPFR